RLPRAAGGGLHRCERVRGRELGSGRALRDHRSEDPMRKGVFSITSPWLWLVIIVGGLLSAWLLRDLITPYAPSDVRAERIMLPPGSAGSPLGTDNFGRDMVSRILAGVPVSVAAGIVPAAASMALGTLIGLVSGYVGGAVDRAIMSVMDVMFAFPFILLALLAVAILGPSFWNA